MIIEKGLKSYHENIISESLEKRGDFAYKLAKPDFYFKYIYVSSEAAAKLVKNPMGSWIIYMKLDKDDPTVGLQEFYSLPDDLNKLSRSTNWNTRFERYLSKVDTDNIMHTTLNKNIMAKNDWNKTVRYHHYDKHFVIDSLTNKTLKINRKQIITIDAMKTIGCAFDIKCENLQEMKIPNGSTSLYYSNKTVNAGTGPYRQLPNFVFDGQFRELRLTDSCFTGALNIPKTSNISINYCNFDHNAVLNIKDVDRISIKGSRIYSKFVNLQANKQVDLLFRDDFIFNEVDTHILSMQEYGWYDNTEFKLTVKTVKNVSNLRPSTKKGTIIIENFIVSEKNKKLTITVPHTWGGGYNPVVQIKNVKFEIPKKELKIAVNVDDAPRANSSKWSQPDSCKVYIEGALFDYKTDKSWTP